jgi:ribonuclease HI
MTSLPSWALEPVPNLTPAEIQATIKLLQACDRDLNAQKVQVQTDSFVQGKQDELIRAQQTEMVSLKQEANNPFKNPILWFAAGMIVTGLTIHWVR